MAAKKYFWIRKSGNFGKSTRFNDPMPPLDSDMENHLLKLGYIDTKQHDSFESAQASAFEKAKELNIELSNQNEGLKKKNEALEKENKELFAENVDLKNKLNLDMSFNEENNKLKAEIEELRAELEDFPKNVSAANKKIKKLEKELEEATKPGGK